MSALMIDDADIVFVSNALANGGAARVISVLAKAFHERGSKVGVAVYSPYPGEYPLPEGVVREYAPAGGAKSSKIRRIAWLRSVARRNPDAAIVAFEYFVNMQTIVACMGLPNRVVVSERNDPSRVGSGFPTGWLRERLYRRADMLVCQTDDAASYFSDRVKKCVILNPLKEGLPTSFEGVRRKAVVTFCRLERQKNLPMLIRAFSRFHDSNPDYALEIYGDGREHDALVSLIDDFGLSGIAKIRPGRPDVHDVVRDAAMFVLPSDYEGLSNSMLEAMAIGLPVVCTDCPCGGARMVITDGENGLLVPVGDEVALMQAMHRVACDPVLAERLSARAIALRKELSASKVCFDWMEAIGCDY